MRRKCKRGVLVSTKFTFASMLTRIVYGTSFVLLFISGANVNGVMSRHLVRWNFTAAGKLQVRPQRLMSQLKTSLV